MRPYGILSNFKQFLDSLRGRGMRYIFHGTQDEWDALSDAEKDRYDQAELSGGTDNSCPIYVSQKIADGDLNPVSSDAVAKHVYFNRSIPLPITPDTALTCPENTLTGMTFHITLSDRLKGYRPFVTGIRSHTSRVNVFHVATSNYTEDGFDVYIEFIAIAELTITLHTIWQMSVIFMPDDLAQNIADLTVEKIS